MEQSKHHSLMSLFLFVIAYQKPFANRSLIFVEDAKINQFFLIVSSLTIHFFVIKGEWIVKYAKVIN